MDSATSVAVVGLGAIGGGIAESILRTEIDLRVFDVRAEAMARFDGRAALLADVASAGEADVALIAVVSDQQVRDVVEAILLGAPRCFAVVVVSTIAFSTLHAIRASLAEQGIALVDCGVSGGGRAASDGFIAAMVGADPDVCERCRPVLAAFAEPLVYMGPSGAGMTAKLARNVIHYGERLAAYEGQLLAYRGGVDLLKLAEVVRASDERIGGTASYFSGERPHETPDDADEAFLARQRARVAVAHKDLRAALELAGDLGVALPLAELTDQRYERVLGLGDATDGAPGPAR